MNSISDYIKKVKDARDKIYDVSEEAIYKHEKEILALNTSQIDQSKGFDGQLLKSTNSKFKGVYTLATQLIATQSNPLTSKTAGTPYNFVWTGDALGRLELDVNDSNGQVTIFSTGTGSGQKAEFFKSFPTLFGLTEENTKKTNEIVLQEILNFLNTKL